MKIKQSLLVAFLIATQIGTAQTADSKIAVGLNLIKNEYNGDYGNGIFETKKSWYSGGGMSLTGYLSPSFDLGLQGTFGKYGYYTDEVNYFVGTKMDASLFTHYKLNNGYLLKEDAKLSPFISLGIGFATYGLLSTDKGEYPTIIKDKADLVIPMGIGLKYQFNNWLALQYQYLYNITNSDLHDQNRTGLVNNFFGTPSYPGIKSGNDMYGQHIFGLVLSLGKAKDTDKDGIADKMDKCNSTPMNVKVDLNGCPVDADKDGVADYLDNCSDTPTGVKVDSKGCPVDSDKDGVADYLDKCASVKGIAKFDGCPDTDNDGVQDKEDKCPTVAGLIKLNGCPDKDGDGIADDEDKCPTIAGSAKFQGCPDTDGDGVPDNLDKCPDVYGITANKGCPEVKAETKKIFEQALQGIQFESGKDVIKPISFPILNKVVNVMKDNASYSLEINGHTDSQGDDAMNLLLSEKRAYAVKAYLVKYGIEPEKLSAKGYGETIPVVENTTAAGRAKNRRVEFKVNF